MKCRTSAFGLVLEANRSLEAITAIKSSTCCDCPGCGGADLHGCRILLEIQLGDYISQKRLTYGIRSRGPWDSMGKRCCSSPLTTRCSYVTGRITRGLFCSFRPCWSSEQLGNFARQDTAA